MNDDPSPGGAVLADRRRRHVCRYLSSQDDVVVTLEELTVAVADAERAAGGGTVAGTDERRIATTLHHLHLPKLDAAGVVRYDHGRRTVRADSGLAVALELLAVLDDREPYADLRV